MRVRAPLRGELIHNLCNHFTQNRAVGRPHCTATAATGAVRRQGELATSMALQALLSPSPPPVAAAAWRAPAPTRACSARSAPAAAGRVIAHGKPPVVILPGFLKGDELYSEMADTLRARGHPAVVVARVSQWQWYPTLAGADFGWYLDAVDAAVADAESKAPGCGGVALVGHSAGGWLARAYLCRERYCGVSYGERAAGRVACVLTLGSPHTNLEAYPLGRATERRRGERADMPEAAAGSSLAWTNTYAASTRIPSESLVQRLYVCERRQPPHGHRL